MKQNIKKMIIGFASLCASTFAFSLATQAQYDTKPAPPPVAAQTKSTMGGGMVTFEAKLVDPTAKAAKKTATVEVKVEGNNLVDPDMTDGKPHPGQAHLHYQLDNGPIIATTATKLSFHGLAAGPHTIVVNMAGNDHQVISKDNTLTVTIP